MAALDLDDPKHARADDKLRHEIALWLTTVTPDGQPQSTPDLVPVGRLDVPVLQPAGPAEAPQHRGEPEGCPCIWSGTRTRRTSSRSRAWRRWIRPRRRRMPSPSYLEKYRSAIDGFGWTPASMAADYSVAVRVTPTRFRIES